MARTRRDKNLKNGAVAYGVFLQDSDTLTIHPSWFAGMDALVATRCAGDYCTYGEDACCVLVLVDDEGYPIRQAMSSALVMPERPY